MTPAAIEAAARALHRFNAPRVANDVEPWESVPPNTQERWKKQAELALLAADETRPPLCPRCGYEHGPGPECRGCQVASLLNPAPADPFARLSRPNIDNTDEPPEAA